MNVSYLKKVLLLILLNALSNEVNAQKFTNYTSSDGLVDGIIYSIVEDHNNNYWFGTWANPDDVSGLVRFDGTDWVKFTTSDGLANNKVWKIFEDSNDNLWIGTENGLTKYTDGIWTNYSTADGLATNHVTSIIEDVEGNMWFGTSTINGGSGGVSKFDGTSWTNYTTADGLVNNNISALFQDSNGNFWFGSFDNGGVSKFDGTSWITYTAADGLAATSIYEIMEGNTNEIWFANYSNTGFLSKFDGATWSTFTKGDGLLDNRHRALLKDNHGNLWFGGNSGVNMYDGENISAFTTADGLLNNIIREIMQDSQRRFWFGTFTGVSMLDLNLVPIPDVNFEQALIDLGIDTNGLTGDILRSDAEAVTDLNVPAKSINDLTGIDAFINLVTLGCQDNQITSFDISYNVNLESLDCSGFNNQFGSLDLSKNAKIKSVISVFNDLTSVDVSNNPDLKLLILQYNQLTSLNVSKNPNLELLFCNSNQISSLDLSNNPILSNIVIGDNLPLTSLDIRNGNNFNVNSFYAGNTPNLTCINSDPIISQAIINSGKTFSEDCGDFVYVPDPNFEQALIDLGIDSDGVVNTSFLREDAETMTSLNLNNALFTPEGYGFNNPEIVNVKGKIADLTGIEAFVNLTNLQVSYSDLETVNVSSNVLLEELWVTDGILTEIDVTANSNLIRLGVQNNNISGTINVTQNAQLEWLLIHYNNIDTIDVSQNPNLWNLWINNNSITLLDISLNPNLQRLDVQYNTGLSLITDPAGYPAMTSLNLSGIGLSNYNQYAILFPNVQWLLLNNNILTAFNSNNTLLVENLFLNNNNIDKLILSSNTLLKQVNVKNNVLTELNLANGNNAELLTLNATNNLLTCISVDDPTNFSMPYALWNTDTGVVLSANCNIEPEVILIPDSNFEQALIDLGFDTNGLNGNVLLTEAESITSLDVSNSNIIKLTGIESFINLTNLNVSNNLLDTVNLISNIKLVNLDVSSNVLSELVVYSGSDLSTLNASDNQLNDINSTNFINLSALDLSSNLLDVLDLRSNPLLVVLDVTDNVNLLCIAVINPNSIPVGWSKDATATFSSNPDCIPPTIIAQPFAIYLNNRGTASIVASAFDNGSSDNVTLNANLIFSVDISSFACSHLGLNIVNLTVTDEAGNSSTQAVNLTVADIIPPKVSALNSFTYDLNGMSAYNLSPSSVLKSVTDNCGVASLSVNPSVFTSPGTYTVALTATDQSDNTSTVNTTVIIVDSAASTKLKFKKNLELTVYPVPFTNAINISFSKAIDLNTVSVTLFNFNMIPSGIVFSPNNGKLISNFTGALPTGNYILQVTISGETKTAQIIKN